MGNSNLEKIDGINALLANWEVLYTAAENLQIDEGNARTPISDFESMYLSWLQDGYALLSNTEYYQLQLWTPYEGTNPVNELFHDKPVGIKTYITNFAAKIPRYPFAALVSGRTRQENLTWKYPFSAHFEGQFREQRRVLLEAREWYRAQGSMQTSSPSNVSKIASLNLHPKIVRVASNRFSSREYDDAIAYSLVAVNEAVRDKSGSSAKDGVALMQHAFSAKDPLLRLSKSEDEQKAFMDLFAASWSALRNPKAHSTVPNIVDVDTALEFLAFASALMRLVDRAEVTAQVIVSSDS